MERARNNAATAAMGAVLVIAVLLIYLPVLHHQFISGWDDDVYITDNVHVTTGFTLSNLKWAFTSTEPFYWHPLTWLSHMLDYRLFGLNSGAHHYVNAVLHAINALLLFLLLFRATAARWQSFVAAALFAIHPLNVETVAWAAERKSILSALFSLVTIAAYGWYARRPGWKRYLAVPAAFLLALMCKPAAVTLPAVLLILDFWPLDRYPDRSMFRRWGWLLLEKLPLFALGARVSAITISSGHSAALLVPFSELPLSTRLEIALLNYVAYLGKSLWPARLCAFHPHRASYEGISMPAGEVVAAAVLLAAITGLAIYLWRSSFFLAGWSIFLVTLLPMIGIIQTGYQGVTEHFTYIPSIGIYIVLAWGLMKIAEGFPIPRLAPQLISLGLLGSYAAVTVRDLPHWQDGVTLFGHARATERPHPWLEQLYGNALRTAGRNDEAMQHFQLSCAWMPMNEFCHKEMADILFDRRQYDAAIMEYETVLVITKKQTAATYCLDKTAEAYLRLGSVDAAQRKISDALAVDPNDATALRLREQLYNSRGQ